MTNKLRSVVESINKWRDFFPVDYKDAVPVIPYEDAKQAQFDLLDAIIEDMKTRVDELEDVRRGVGVDYNAEMECIACIKELKDYINTFKQAREELSSL